MEENEEEEMFLYSDVLGEPPTYEYKFLILVVIFMISNFINLFILFFMVLKNLPRV